jgi:hypothetical protein
MCDTLIMMRIAMAGPVAALAMLADVVDACDGVAFSVTALKRCFLRDVSRPGFAARFGRDYAPLLKIRKNVSSRIGTLSLL